jgi:aryl-alcohol dehydrogenase-like predicted oxidoreductase
MERRALGRTGLTLSRLGLGCGNFGGIGSAPQFFGMGESEGEAFALMDAAVGLGIGFFDTADAYGGGRSEAWIGRWRAARGAPVLLSTKVFHSVEGDPADRGLAADRILRQIEGSLERLGVERVEMYVIHEPDPETPLEETLRALDGLVRAGKVGAIGASNVDGRWLEAALEIAANERLVPIGWVQNSYSLLDRAAEGEVLPLCAERGLGFTPYGPLSGGWLTGKYRRGQAAPAGSRMALRPGPYAQLDREEVYRGLDAFAEAAAERGVDAATLAIAWVLGHPGVTAVIVGPRDPRQLEPARSALALELTQGEREELASLFPA